MRKAALCLIVASIAACADDPAGPVPPLDRPTIASVSAAPGPHNVLSMVVTAEIRHADSAAVRYRSANGPPGQSAAARVIDGMVVIPVLALLPSESYSMNLVAWGAGEVVVGTAFVANTGALPTDLPSFHAGGPDPSPGFIVLAAGRYGIVLDNDGRVVWYRQFESGPGLNFMTGPTGRYYARPPTPEPGDVEPWVEMDALGNITRTLGCALGQQARFHDLVPEADGSVWLLCDETRSIDLTDDSGVVTARVSGTNVQHVSADGSLLMRWSPFDHFAITDLDAAERTGPAVNWTHGNAIDFDTDGNILVSFRNLNEVTKIDANSGTVLWRMGGVRNEFEFVGASPPPFVHQHGVRAAGDGTILLLDNSGSDQESRAERYLIDADGRTATLVRSYGSEPGVLTPVGGSVQNLPGGRTLVSFGTQGRVEEYDADGQVAWRILGNAGYVFRAQRISSLYAPGAGGTR